MNALVMPVRYGSTGTHESEDSKRIIRDALDLEPDDGGLRLHSTILQFPGREQPLIVRRQ